MSEKFKQNKGNAFEIGGKLSRAEVETLLEKYGVHGLKEDPEHSEYFQIGDDLKTGIVKIQKLRTMGFNADGKPKSIEQSIRESLGLESKK